MLLFLTDNKNVVLWFKLALLCNSEVTGMPEPHDRAGSPQRPSGRQEGPGPAVLVTVWL